MEQTKKEAFDVIFEKSDIFIYKSLIWGYRFSKVFWILSALGVLQAVLDQEYALIGIIAYPLVVIVCLFPHVLRSKQGFLKYYNVELKT